MEFVTYLNYAIGIQEVRQAVGLFIVVSVPIAMILYAFLVNIYRKKQSSLDEFESLANEYSSIMEENASKLKELRIAVEENEKALKRIVDVYRKPRAAFTIHPSVVSALEYGNKVIKNAELEIEEQERIDDFKDFIRSGKKLDAENKGGFLIPKIIKKRRRGFIGWLFRLFKNDNSWEYVDPHKRLAINERITDVQRTIHND